VIGGRARERKPQGDIHRISERRDLDGGHSDVVIGGDDGVKFPAHRSYKNCIRRKRPLNACGARGRFQQLRVFAAESPTIAAVWIQSAQRNSRRRNSEPCAEPLAGEARDFDDGSCAQILSYAA